MACMLANDSAEPSRSEQQPVYASPPLPPASPFLSLEAAIGSDPVPCEEAMVEHNVNEVSVETLRFVIRQVHKMQME